MLFAVPSTRASRNMKRISTKTKTNKWKQMKNKNMNTRMKQNKPSFVTWAACNKIYLMERYFALKINFLIFQRPKNSVYTESFLTLRELQPLVSQEASTKNFCYA